MKALKQAIMAFLFMFGLWLLIAGTDPQELIVGGIVSLLISLFFLRKTGIYSDFRITPKSIVYFVLYVFVFMWELVKSNLDVAFRVIQPTLPINPGIVRVQTSLKSPLARILLANSITLTPGTLTVETDGEDFYIHWIDVTAKDVQGASEKIVRTFEKYLEVIFG